MSDPVDSVKFKGRWGGVGLGVSGGARCIGVRFRFVFILEDLVHGQLK